MKCEGYKLSGYDATYRKALFDVRDRGDNVIEIEDVNGGITFILDLDRYGGSDRPHTWRGKEPQNNGLEITYGSKGIYQKLKYGCKKLKKN